MGDVNKAYEDISAAQSKATAAVVSLAKNYFPYLILILNVVVTIISRLFVAELHNPFSAEFFISLGNNLLSTSFCYATFVSYGEKMARRTMIGYDVNRKRWSELSAKVRVKSDLFVSYCRQEAEREREERREAIIANNTLITAQGYAESYKGLTPRQVRSLRREGLISASDARYIRKANRVKVKPIKPLLILCGVQIEHLNEAGRDGIRYSTASVLSRPLIVFITSALVSMISGRWLGLADPSVIYDMLFLSLLIVISSVLGYSAGAESAKRDHDKIKARIFFLEKYEQNI